VKVTTVFHYGAVDIDTKHLVVWVLLDGASPDDLPTWWSSDGTSRGTSDEMCDSWLRSIAATVRHRFVEAGWPDADHVTVLFDADERVEEGGGFFYFK